MQFPEQHWLSVLHVTPSTKQPVAPQKLLLQSFLQQSDEDVHALPSAPHRVPLLLLLVVPLLLEVVVPLLLEVVVPLLLDVVVPLLLEVVVPLLVLVVPEVLPDVLELVVCPPPPPLPTNG